MIFHTGLMSFCPAYHLRPCKFENNPSKSTTPQERLTILQRTYKWITAKVFGDTPPLVLPRKVLSGCKVTRRVRLTHGAVCAGLLSPFIALLILAAWLVLSQRKDDFHQHPKLSNAKNKLNRHINKETLEVPLEADSKPVQGLVRSGDVAQPFPLPTVTPLADRCDLAMYEDESYVNTLEEVIVMKHLMVFLGIKLSDVEPMVKIPYHPPLFQQVYFCCYDKVIIHPKPGIPLTAVTFKAKKRIERLFFWKVSVHRILLKEIEAPKPPTCASAKQLQMPQTPCSDNQLQMSQTCASDNHQERAQCMSWRNSKNIRVRRHRQVSRRTSVVLSQDHPTPSKVPSPQEAVKKKTTIAPGKSILHDTHIEKGLGKHNVMFSQDVHIHTIPPHHHDKKARTSREHKDRKFIYDLEPLEGDHEIEEDRQQPGILSRILNSIKRILCCNWRCS